MTAKTIAAWGLVAALGMVGLVSAPACRRSSPAAEAAASYFCPMHPQIVQDAPGQCPICQMQLERREPHARATPPARRGIAFYRNPMDPAVHSAVPMKDPMGMDYVPVYEDETEAAGSDRARVAMSEEKRQLLGVRTEAVRREPLDGTFRTVGRVAVDERRVHHVHSKVEGYVEQLFVDFTGRLVEKGEPLLAIYSPDLVATQQEYLLARRAEERLRGSPVEKVADGGRDLLAAARQRLLLWDVSPADIRRLEETGVAQRTLNLYAPMSGYVLEKTALHGMRVTPMDSLFRIADLSTVWVLADVYEQDISRVREGARAVIHASHVPDREWTGRIAFIAPVLDEATRTVKVRIEVPNADAALKPEMFTDVVLHYGGPPALVVPADAVVDTGRRQVVFVDEGDGTLTPRTVTLGAKTGERYPVVSGVTEGERVVVGANFLVDSESTLRAAISGAEAKR